MQNLIVIQSFENIRRVYSARRDREIAIRVRYDVRAVNGCKLVHLRKIETLDS